MEEENNIQVIQVSPVDFDYQEYSQKDTSLLSSSLFDTTFTSSTDYIEYYAYDGSKNILESNTGPYTNVNRNYKVINGDVIIYPSVDLEEAGYDQGTFYSTYNFYRKRLGSDPEREKYYKDPN